MKLLRFVRRPAPLIAIALLAGCEEAVEAPVYQLVPAAERDIIVSVSAAGIVEPIKTIEVKSKASGEIMDVRVETGDVVRRGDLLVSVDPRIPHWPVAPERHPVPLWPALRRYEEFGGRPRPRGRHGGQNRRSPLSRP